MPQLDFIWFLSNFILAWSLLLIVLIILSNQINNNLINFNTTNNSNIKNEINNWVW
uniref:ATP synthase F0 subunit 8 n=1 Tax=Peniagone sp. YYH-2013 TaxID=1430316 RepID=W5VY88_9ECHN|nr:ATP synthase F0 subunit 8 [Peniagone sp. YYH-2013]